MLTLEGEVSQLVFEKLPEKLEPELSQEFFIKVWKNNKPQVYLGEIVLEISETFKDLADRLENNWSKYAEPEKLENLKKASCKIDETVKDLEELLSRSSEIRNKRMQGDLNLEKELINFKKSLQHFGDVLKDTIEFVNIALEVREMRSQTLGEDKLREAKEILFSI
ncbi:MAG: hypothetical protein DSM106950_27405 [Stigonema ocellatum SAG 48.90 = DSM 106950]|nr:hypothetical protein [Stigonema ocellatum SAG 48.90 = DSM 106950]